MSLAFLGNGSTSCFPCMHALHWLGSSDSSISSLVTRSFVFSILIEFILMCLRIRCHLSHDLPFTVAAKFIQNSHPCFCLWAKITPAHVLNSTPVPLNVAELPLSVKHPILIRLFSASGACLTSHSSIVLILALTFEFNVDWSLTLHMKYSTRWDPFNLGWLLGIICEVILASHNVCCCCWVS